MNKRIEKVLIHPNLTGEDIAYEKDNLKLNVWMHVPFYTTLAQGAIDISINDKLGQFLIEKYNSRSELTSLLGGFIIYKLARNHYQSHLSSRSKEATQVAAKQFTTSGLFKQVRNPIYLHQRLCGIGLLAMYPTIQGAAGLFLYFGLSEWLVRREEYICVKKFGDEYTTYKEETPRWIPKNVKQKAIALRNSLYMAAIKFQT